MEINLVNHIQETTMLPAGEVPLQQRNAAAASRAVAVLTSNEARLILGLAAGHTNQQIAQELHRSEKTIRNQLTRLYRKLGARNRAEAVAIHLRRGNG